MPTGILRLPWLKFLRVFSSVIRQISGYTSQRRGRVRILPNWWIVLFYVLFVSIVFFYVLFVCKCVLYYCHRVVTHLQLNISYHSAAGRIMSMKNSNNISGNRNLDLPACSTVPQSTAPARAPPLSPYSTLGLLFLFIFEAVALRVLTAVW